MRVLVVDDDETFCRLLTEILESRGMEVAIATNGFMGYEISTHERYDLFIIDVRMPVLLGTELAETLKKTWPEAKIILISAFPDEPLLKISASIGAALLSKPFSAGRLLEAVERALGGLEKQES